MSGGRFSKKFPEFVYFVGEDGQEWISGPYIRPQSGRVNRKFRLVEVLDDEKLNAKNKELLNKE